MTDNSLTLDNDGHLIQHTDWSPQVAQQLADSLAISLTDEHFLILNAVMEFYTRFGHPPTTRPLLKYLSQSLPQLDLDNAKREQLFNTGLVA